MAKSHQTEMNVVSLVTGLGVTINIVLRRFSVAVLVSLSFTAGAALLNIDWQQNLGGTDNDYATAIAQTPDGGYLISGNSRSGISGNKATSGNGDFDLWILKLDLSGAKVWETSVGGGGADNTYANSMHVTGDGGCVVGGSFNNTDAWAVRLDPNGNVIWDRKYGGRGAVLSITSTPDGGFVVAASSEAATSGKTSPFYGGTSDFWVLKLDPAGNKVWENSFGGSGVEYPYSIVATPEGGYLVGGFSDSDISGNKTSPTFGEGDFWLVKIDGNGNHLWDKSYGGPLAERIYTIAPTCDGGYLLGGLASTVSAHDPPISGLGDYWVVKIDAAGNVQWNKLFGGDDHELLSKIVVGIDGTFLLAGTSFSGVSGNKSSPNRGTARNADYWVLCIDGDGNKISDQSFGGADEDTLFSAGASAGGGYALAGVSASGVDGNKSTSTFGAGDFWAIKITAHAAVQIAKEWEVSLGGVDDEGGDLVPIAQTSDDGYFLAGSSRSDISGNKSSAAFGDWDGWVARLDRNGNKLWDRAFGGTGADFITGMVVTSDDGCVLAGWSASNPSGNKTSPRYGANDFWVLRLDAGGNKLWENSFGGGAAGDAANCLAATPDGGFIIGGLTESPTGGTKTSPYYGAGDFWVIKLDANGNKIWENSFGGSGSESLYSILVTPDGYLLGGASSSGPSGNKSSPVYGVDDFWLVKLDLNGNKVWDQTYGGSLSDRIHSIAPAFDGGYLLGGVSKSGISGTKTTPNYGSYDYWLVKTDAAGLPLWDKTFGGDFTELFARVVPANDGTFLLTGHSDSGVSGTKSSANRGAGENADEWIIAIDAQGTELWQESFGGCGGDLLRWAIPTSDGGYALAGLSDSNISGNKTAPKFGGYDLWVLKVHVANSTAPLTINCSGDLVQSTDPGLCSAVISLTANAGGGSGEVSIACTPASGSVFVLGTTPVQCTATDSAGGTASCSFNVTVQNPSPTLVITGPLAGTIFPLGTAVTFAAAFTDNPADTHTATWTFGASSTAGTVNEAGGVISASYIFAAPGVYFVSVRLTDACGNQAAANTVGGLPAMVVIYDPNGGYVTGGGWFNSPAGAYIPVPALNGKASFGFVSKYQKGAVLPIGQTEFQFKVSDLNFHSTSYDWLVVAGARAQYKGSGTINGAGDYAFMLTAIDGQIGGGGGADKLRMKIWDNASNSIVYDNQIDAADSANPTTTLGGGSIAIHKE
jgi:hypothetical protein